MRHTIRATKGTETMDVKVVPETLEAAQDDMNTRNPGSDAGVLRRIAFHRYNAEMFRLAGKRLAEQGLAADDDWTHWCYKLQTQAVQQHLRRLPSRHGVTGGPAPHNTSSRRRVTRPLTD